jgi:signal transduction histidine kinase
MTSPSEIYAAGGARADSSWRRRAGPLVRYSVSVVSVGAMLLLTGWLKEAFQGTPNALFFCAMILSGWFGGFGPGLLASVLSILAIKYYFTPPAHTLVFAYSEAARNVVLLVAGVFISLLGDRQRRDEKALIEAREELEKRVQTRTLDLTEVNERLKVEVRQRATTETELQRLNRAWRVRSGCNQAISRCTEEDELLDEVCRAVVTEGGYRLAWVGYPGHDEAKLIHAVARAGQGQGYLDNLSATWKDEPRGQGPTGTAIRTGMPVTCNEFSTDPRLVPWRERAAEHGLESSVALPLKADGAVLGALVVYSEEPCAFDEKETDLLMQAASDLTHAIALLRTKSEREAAERALKRTEAELGRVARVTTMGELTASIAHEVNQPLAAVVTNANAALRWLAIEPPDFDEARSALRNIVRDGNRAGDVISRIRAILKKDEPLAQLLDVNGLIREIVALVRPEVDRRRVSLGLELAGNLPFVTGDRVRLQQVLLNLVINALDALGSVTDRERAIRIRSQAPDSRAVIVAIEDTGIGIDPGRESHLFEAFYTTKPEGLGMGLSISRSIIEAHGGRLSAKPNATHGATFEFSLPSGEGAPE